MSVLVAVAFLFYLVENRPVAKHVVSAKHAASSQSPPRSATVNKAAVKKAKTATARPVTPASAPPVTSAAAAGRPDLTPLTVGPNHTAEATPPTVDAGDTGPLVVGDVTATGNPSAPPETAPPVTTLSGPLATPTQPPATVRTLMGTLPRPD